MNTVIIDIWQKYAEIVTVLMCYSIKTFKSYIFLKDFLKNNRLLKICNKQKKSDYYRWFNHHLFMQLPSSAVT